MKKVNVLQLRQSLSKIIELLERTGEPILLEKSRRPAAVLISLTDFKTRFVEKDAEVERKRILEEINNMARRSTDTTSGEDLVRELRDA